MRIAYCDESHAALDALKKHLDRFARENRDMDVVCDAFSTTTELLARISAGVFYDLVFLDVVMPGISGLDAAKEIYAANKITRIVFLTTAKEFAVDAYAVEALDYLIKPIDAVGFQRAMQRFITKQKNMRAEEILIFEKNSMTKIPLHTLCYVEVYDHYLFYHLADGMILKSRQKLSALEQYLGPNKQFVKPHRSYLVNMAYVQRMDQTCIGLRDGAILPVSKANYKAVADAFLQYRVANGSE